MQPLAIVQDAPLAAVVVAQLVQLDVAAARAGSAHDSDEAV